MRSSRPKPLHLLCGRAMLRVRPRFPGRLSGRPGRGRGRPRRRAGDQEAAGRGARSPPRVRRAARPAGHGRRGQRRPDGASPTTMGDDDDGDVLVLPGDTPLLRPATVAALVDAHRASGDAACTRAHGAARRPHGLRPGRARQAMGESRASSSRPTPPTRSWRSTRSTRRSTASAAVVLAPALRRLSPENAQGEYYLTDVVEVLHDAGYRVSAVAADDPAETQGVNDRVQLAGAEAELRRRTNDGWLRRGRHHARPEPAPTSTRPCGSRPTSPCSRARCCRAAPWSAVGAEIGPDTRLVDCVVGDGRGRRAVDRPGRRDRGRRTGRPVRGARSRERPWLRAR